MAEHLLHGTQIGSMVDLMAGESMAQHMGRNLARIEAGIDRESLQQLSDSHRGQMTILATRWKDERRGLGLLQMLGSNRDILA